MDWAKAFDTFGKVLPKLLVIVQAAADLAEARSPKGSGVAKEEFVDRVIEATIGIADDGANPEMKQAVKDFAKRATHAVVDLNNACGHYSKERHEREANLNYIEPYAQNKSTVSLV